MLFGPSPSWLGSLYSFSNVRIWLPTSHVDSYCAVWVNVVKICRTTGVTEVTLHWKVATMFQGRLEVVVEAIPFTSCEGTTRRSKAVWENFDARLVRKMEIISPFSPSGLENRERRTAQARADNYGAIPGYRDPTSNGFNLSGRQYARAGILRSRFVTSDFPLFLLNRKFTSTTVTTTVDSGLISGFRRDGTTESIGPSRPFTEYQELNCNLATNLTNHESIQQSDDLGCQARRRMSFGIRPVGLFCTIHWWK